MHHFVPTPPEGINDLVRTERSKAQTIALLPEEEYGGPDHHLQDTDLWLLALAGVGRAVVADEAVDLVAGVVVLVEAREPLTLKNNGDSALEVLVIYTNAVD